MSLEANKAIVVQLYEEIFNKGDLDLADKLIAPMRSIMILRHRLTFQAAHPG